MMSYDNIKCLRWFEIEIQDTLGKLRGWTHTKYFIRKRMNFSSNRQHQAIIWFPTFKYVLSGWIPERLERCPKYNNLFIVALVEYVIKKARV